MLLDPRHRTPFYFRPQRMHHTAAQLMGVVQSHCWMTDVTVCADGKISTSKGFFHQSHAISVSFVY